MLRPIFVAVAAVLALSIPAPLLAQNDQSPAGGIVAVLDLAKVFESHPGHKAAMGRIEARAEQMRQEFQEQQVKLQQKAREAAQNYQGAQLDQVEIQLRQEEVALQTKARQAQNELMKSEAEAFYKTYEEVMAEVRELCKMYNVALVLRYDSEPIDPSKPETVIRGVQRSVVYWTSDLTPLVLQKVAGANTAGNQGNQGGQGAPARR